MNVVTNINQIQVGEPGYWQVFGDQDLDVTELLGVALADLLLSPPLPHHLDLLLPQLVLLVHVAGIDHLLQPGLGILPSFSWVIKQSHMKEAF